MRRADIVLYALTPGADGHEWLKLPKAFDLHAPGGWFRSSILPHIERGHQRTLWELTWRGPRASMAGKAGAEERAWGRGGRCSRGAGCRPGRR